LPAKASSWGVYWIYLGVTVAKYNDLIKDVVVVEMAEVAQWRTNGASIRGNWPRASLSFDAVAAKLRFALSASVLFFPLLSSANLYFVSCGRLQSSQRLARSFPLKETEVDQCS